MMLKVEGSVSPDALRKNGDHQAVTVERIEFLSLDGDLLRGFDAQPNLTALNLQDGHLDSTADHNAFVELSGENEHLQSSLIYTAVAAVSTTVMRMPGNRASY